MALTGLVDQSLYSGMLGKSAFFVNIFLIVSIFVGLFFLLWRILSYNVDVEIFRKTKNGSYIITTDKAKKITKEGITYYQLLKNKNIAVEPPRNIDEMFFKQKNNFLFVTLKEHLKLFFDPLNNAYHTTFSNPIPTLTVQDQTSSLWRSLWTKQKVEKYNRPGLWERYGQSIMLFTFFGLMLVAIIIVLNKFEVLSDISQTLERVVTKLQTIQTPELP